MHQLRLLLGETYLNMTPVIDYDACQVGWQRSKHLQTIPPLITLLTHAIGEINKWVTYFQQSETAKTTKT